MKIMVSCLVVIEVNSIKCCHKERHVKQGYITICQCICALHCISGVIVQPLCIKSYSIGLRLYTFVTITLCSNTNLAVQKKFLIQITEEKKTSQISCVTTCSCEEELPLCALTVLRRAELQSSPNRSTLSAAQSASDRFKPENRWVGVGGGGLVL